MPMTTGRRYRALLLAAIGAFFLVAAVLDPWTDRSITHRVLLLPLGAAFLFTALQRLHPGSLPRDGD